MSKERIDRTKELEDRVERLRTKFKEDYSKLEAYKIKLNATTNKGKIKWLTKTITQLETDLSNLIKAGNKAVEELNYYVETRQKLLDDINDLSSRLTGIMLGDIRVPQEEQELTLSELVKQIQELENEFDSLNTTYAGFIQSDISRVKRHIAKLKDCLRYRKRRARDWNRRLEKATKLDIKDDMRKWGNCLRKEQEKIDSIESYLIKLNKILETLESKAG